MGVLKKLHSFNNKESKVINLLASLGDSQFYYNYLNKYHLTLVLLFTEMKEKMFFFRSY